MAYTLCIGPDLVALWTGVGGIEVVALDMVVEVGEGGAPVLAHDTGPAHHPRLVPVLGGHRRDQVIHVYKQHTVLPTQGYSKIGF